MREADRQTRETDGAEEEEEEAGGNLRAESKRRVKAKLVEEEWGRCGGRAGAACLQCGTPPLVHTYVHTVCSTTSSLLLLQRRLTLIIPVSGPRTC